MLRDRDDAAVARLLQLRPDLATPPPTDFSQIASRATPRHSVTQALHLLTAFEVWVAARASNQTGAFSASDLVVDRVELADLETALDRLLELSLVWGDASSLRPVRAMASMLAQVDQSDVPTSRPPGVESQPPQSAPLVAKVAAGSAFEFVRRMDVLVEHCDHQPTKLVRRGGLAARDVRTLASLLDIPSSVAAAHLEIAQGAGLLGIAARGSDDVLLPTAEYDTWRGLALTDQWARLVDAWLRHHPPSGPWWLKGLCLEAFGDPEDAVVVTPAGLRRWLAWQRPRRHVSADREAMTMLEQSAWLGVTALGARSGFLSFDVSPMGVASADAVRVDERRLAALLPPRVDHVLVQADLTAVAPGPLSPDAARDLGALADVESRGGATVYRFSTSSLQRAQRLGWTSDDILATLAQRSTTPLPQPLTYLVRDLDRQPLQRRPPSREQERAPHRLSQRATASGSDPDLTTDDQLDAAALSAIISALRNDDPDESQDSSGRTSDNVFQSPILTLREAVETGEVVWFGLVDTHGSSFERVVHALSVDGGWLTARDVKTREAVSIALHRITAAHIMRSAS
ncbi:MAG: helicase-associated domain-containing protein [Propionibacteriales bacterium]|nr:helicase-associated domain-containing protein [Propionibacteriales bacterium]